MLSNVWRSPKTRLCEKPFFEDDMGWHGWPRKLGPTPWWEGQVITTSLLSLAGIMISHEKSPQSQSYICHHLPHVRMVRSHKICSQLTMCMTIPNVENDHLFQRGSKQQPENRDTLSFGKQHERNRHDSEKLRSWTMFATWVQFNVSSFCLLKVNKEVQKSLSISKRTTNDVTPTLIGHKSITLLRGTIFQRTWSQF